MKTTITIVVAASHRLIDSRVVSHLPMIGRCCAVRQKQQRLIERAGATAAKGAQRSS